MFGIGCNCYKSEKFSPTGWTQNCPNAAALSPKMAYGEPWTSTGWKKFDGKVVGSYSPGSVFQCNDSDCSMITTKGCARKDTKGVMLKENIPIGWGSTMTGPYADNNCMSGINGVNKASMKNPYGKVYPEGKQMYGFCEKGVNNYFSD